MAVTKHINSFVITHPFSSRLSITESTLRKNCYWIYKISAKSMCIIGFKEYAIRIYKYAKNSIACWFESMISMLLVEML